MTRLLLVIIALTGLFAFVVGCSSAGPTATPIRLQAKPTTTPIRVQTEPTATLTLVQAESTATPTRVQAEPTTTPTPTAVFSAAPMASVVLDTSGNPQAGQLVFESKCSACHTVSGVSQGTVCPELTYIGTVAVGRKSGMSADEYIRESIIDPSAFVVEGFPPAMPPGLQDTIGDGFNDLLAYLAGLK